MSYIAISQYLELYLQLLLLSRNKLLILRLLSLSLLFYQNGKVYSTCFHFSILELASAVFDMVFFLFLIFQCQIIVTQHGYSMYKLFFNLRINIVFIKEKYCFDFWLMEPNILPHNNNNKMCIFEDLPSLTLRIQNY